MYSFNSLQLTNYLLWLDLEFVFEEGVTLVSGNNGSGKSLFASAIPSILYDIEPIPDKAKAVLNLSTTIGDKTKEYDFTALNYGKKNRFEVAINGKSQKTETINAARNLIEQHFCNNIQYSLFETTVSISGLTEHPLAKKGNKSSQRLDWLHETLAYASLLDSYSDLVQNKLDKTKNDSIKFKVLKQQLENLDKVAKPDIDLDKLKADQKLIVKEIKELEEQFRLRQEAIKLNDKVIEKPELTISEAKKKLTAFEGFVKYQNELKPLYDSYEEDLKKYQQLRDTIDNAKAKYISLCKKSGKKVIDPAKAINKLREVIGNYEDKLRSAAINNDKYERQTEQRNLATSDHPLQWSREEDYTSRITAMSEELAIAKRQVKFSESGDRNCPICGSKNHGLRNHRVDPRDIIQRYTKRIKLLEEDLLVFRARQIKYVEYINTEELETKLELYRNLLKAAQRYLDVKKFDVEKPEQVEYDEAKHKKAIKLVEKYKEIYIAAKAYEEAKKHSNTDNIYIDVSKETNLKNIDILNNKLKECYAKQTEISDKIIQNETNLALYKKYRNDKVRLIEEATPLKQAFRDNELLTIAKKALGRDGFRTRRLESTMELFVNNLNEFVPLLWNEPFKFDIEIGKRKCDIIAHRNNKAGSISSISGSEKRRWQLLAALAMLRLLPHNRRCDTIILDELEANLDDKYRHQVMKDFIPELQKTVSKVLIISPMSRKELGLMPDRAFTVEKRNNKSRLLVA